MEGDPDLQWVRACQAGDVEAFDPLVLRHQRRVYTLAYRMLGNPAEAEDLTQEVFVAAFEQIRQFRGESAFSSWLHAIVVRRGLNRLRDLGRRPLARARSMDDPPQDGRAALDVRDPRPGPDALSEQSELEGILHKGLLQLPGEARILLILRDNQGLAYEKIAEMLNLELGTVKSRIHRARQSLVQVCRASLKGSYNGVH